MNIFTDTVKLLTRLKQTLLPVEEFLLSLSQDQMGTDNKVTISCNIALPPRIYSAYSAQQELVN